MYPTDRKYSKEHEWVKLDGDTARMGITDFAQSELGDIVFVELPEVGVEFKAGDVLGTIESVKAVSEIFAPIAGKVASVNDALNDQPELINEAPHEGGWYCSVTPSDTSEIDALMDADGYAELAGK